MKSFISFVFILISLQSNAQIKGLLQKANDALGITESKGSEKEEMIAGLKQALSIGVEKGTSLLSKEDGFFKNDVLKILLPPEAEKVEKTLRNIGLGNQVDEANAITIVRGSDSAATQYLRQTTTTALANKFRPVIENSLNKVNATKHWATIINGYNKVSLKKINPDLTAYVTERALNGIFYQMAEEEKKIRRDPLARTTDLLKKVFGNFAKK
jgi:hypothetical protein